MSICFHDRIVHVVDSEEVECDFCQEVFESEEDWQRAITYAEVEYSQNEGCHEHFAVPREDRYAVPDLEC